MPPQRNWISITRLREAGDNTDEDDQRNTVADTPLGDLLTQPHDEDRAAGESQNGQRNKRHGAHSARPDAVGVDDRTQKDGGAVRLHRRQITTVT